MKPKTIVFDLGGVLGNDMPEELFRTAIAPLTGADPAEVDLVRRQLWESFAYRKLDPARWRELERNFWTQVAARLGLAQPPDYFIRLSIEYTRPVPGMLELLQRLCDAGLPPVLCSNQTPFWAVRVFDRLGLARFFTAQRTFFSCYVGAPKSSPTLEMFHAVLRAADSSDPSDCIFVDDRAPNVRRAIEAGMVGVIFPSEATWGADYLAAILEKMGVFEGLS